MLMFLATVLEQLDFAHEQISKADIHNARFGVMLTDNAVELVLHQIAKDKSNRLNMFGRHGPAYEHQAALEKALGRDFKDKVRFARLEQHADNELSQSINIMHGFRNEVYHAGLEHHEILPALAVFYFDIACHFVEKYNPRGVGWGSNLKLPERAQKYFNGDGFTPGNLDEYRQGCRDLAATCGHNPQKTISTLADHLDRIIEQQNACIDVISQGVYEGQQTTREKAVIETQAWRFAFSSKGKALLAEKSFQGNMFDWVNWVIENIDFKFNKDPIPAWIKQVEKLRNYKSPHAALAHYNSFVNETADLREMVEDATGQVEAEIDAAIDRARGR